jgi:hypothetical protein
LWSILSTFNTSGLSFFIILYFIFKMLQGPFSYLTA